LISIFASGYVLIPPLPSFSWCLGWCPQEGVWAFWMSQWVDTPLLSPPQEQDHQPHNRRGNTQDPHNEKPTPLEQERGHLTMLTATASRLF